MNVWGMKIITTELNRCVSCTLLPFSREVIRLIVKSPPSCVCSFVQRLTVLHVESTLLFSFFQASSGNYYFIPYIVTPNHEYMCCESDAQRRASEYMQPSWDNLLGPLCVPLTDRFTSLLKDIHVTSW